MPAIIDAPPLTVLQFRLEAISAYDGIIRRAQADQYRHVQLAREAAAVVEGVTDASSPAERDLATRSFIAELATMLGLHETSASRLVAEAERLTGARAGTLAALEAGQLSLAQVRSVLELTQGLPVEVSDAVERVALDAAAAAVADGVVSTNAELRRRMRRVRERLHPEPLADRRERAIAERRVCLEPAPDGMAWLSLFLEAERAVAIEHRLHALARREPAAGDARTLPQRAVDVAGDLLLGGVLTTPGSASGSVANSAAGPATGSAAGRATGSATGSTAGSGAGHSATPATETTTGFLGTVQPRINVTVPVLTLLGVSDEPAELEGYGPIDADTARRLAAHAPSMRRMLVHPETGAILSYGRETYRAPADLAGFVRVRDGRCRFPGCSRRADLADLDHTTAWQHGGHTDAANLAALCRHHHRLKHESGWRVRHETGGVMRWTSPAGHLLRTLPERPFIPVARGGGSEPPPTRPSAAEDRLPLDPASPELIQRYPELIQRYSAPAGSVPTDSFPADSVPADSVPADSVQAGSVPTDPLAVAELVDAEFEALVASIVRTEDFAPNRS